VSGERFEVIFAGVGGMGALTAGQLLAQAALAHYPHVIWYPNITTARRNAPADCIVIYSHEPIESPLIYQVGAAVIIESSQLKTFETRIKPEGLLLIETAGLKDEVSRDDIKVKKIPGIETALNLGDSRAANLIMLGAYLGATNTLPPELIEKELVNRFSQKPKVLEVNLKALQEGVSLGKG
jgi:2-oxoglutarate ferredoxin oxidoreductase subunit gamma